MNKKIVSGCILSATLLILISIAPSIYADNDKVSIDTTTEFDYDDYTPIQLIFLLINKLRYYEGIESEEDVLQIIESDAELSNIVEELKSYSCGCEDTKSEIAGWEFPMICTLLVPVFIFAMTAYMLGGVTFWIYLVAIIGSILNCFWY